MDGREARERRHAALAQAEERFPEVQRRFEEAYRMRLPRHLLFGAAFFLGLSREEQQLCPVGLFGFASWFQWLAPDQPERVATLDPRLECRFRSDPPEFVTLASGDSDGSHWGLFYDVPSELPALVAHGWARDDGVVYPEGRTLLACIRSKVSGRAHLDKDDARRVRATVAWLDALRPLEDQALAEEGIGPPPPSRIELAHGGVGAYLPGWSMPVDLPSPEARWQAYVKSAPEIGEWIVRADAELARGEGGLALVLGRELHHADRDTERSACTRLLVSAYEALGRGPLAEIARVHHAHRDLLSVGVYGPASSTPRQPEPPWVPPPALVAVQEQDLEALELALGQGPTDDELRLAAAALADRWEYHDRNAKDLSLEMLERFLSKGGRELASDVLGRHLISIRRCLCPEYLVRISSRRGAVQTRELIDLFLKPKDRGLVDRLVAHGARAKHPMDIEFAISTGELDLALLALSSGDVAGYRGFYDGPGGMIEGASLLHFAVCSASTDIVKALLERGLSPDMPDGAGYLPRDLAKMLWFVRPNEANAMVELFDAKRPPAKAEIAAPDFCAGARVGHKKFGEGIIEKIDGQGELAKVTVRFGSEARTLQRRFLELLQLEGT